MKIPSVRESPEPSRNTRAAVGWYSDSRKARACPVQKHPAPGSVRH